MKKEIVIKNGVVKNGYLFSDESDFVKRKKLEDGRYLLQNGNITKIPEENTNGIENNDKKTKGKGK